MDFGTNKTPVEIIKEGSFGGVYFRDIYYDVNGKWYRKSWKEFHAAKQAIALDLVKYLFLTNLNTMKMVLNILLAIYTLMM